MRKSKRKLGLKDLNRFKDKFLKRGSKMFYEIVNYPDEPKFNPQNPHYFLKWVSKFSLLEEKVSNLSDDNFKKFFPFANQKDKNKFQNLKAKEFPLAWFKEKNKI